MGFPHRHTSRRTCSSPRGYPALAPSYIDGSLIDSRFDFDSCGVGFVAQLSAEPSHQILEHALGALARLEHRGAVAADGKSSDGVGVTTAIPREWLLAQSGLSLDESSPLGVAVIFLPQDDSAQRAEIEAAFFEQDMEILTWRPVPIRPEALGEIAASSRPEIWHLLVTSDDTEFFDRRLFLARKQFERSELPGYFVSISSSTMIYKALCAGRLLSEFLPRPCRSRIQDSFRGVPSALRDQRSALVGPCPALAHARAQRRDQYRLEQSRAHVDARSALLPRDCEPFYTPDGSDSMSSTKIAELLCNYDRNIAEAVRMMLPPGHRRQRVRLPSLPRRHHGAMGRPLRARLHRRQTGRRSLDRNGLRPCRFVITDTGLVVAGSEVGLADIDTDTIIRSGRLGPGQMILLDLERTA